MGITEPDRMRLSGKIQRINGSRPRDIYTCRRRPAHERSPTVNEAAQSARCVAEAAGLGCRRTRVATPSSTVGKRWPNSGPAARHGPGRIPPPGGTVTSWIHHTSQNQNRIDGQARHPRIIHGGHSEPTYQGTQRSGTPTSPRAFTLTVAQISPAWLLI